MPSTRSPARSAAGPGSSDPAEDWSALTITNRCNQKCVFCYEGDRSGWRDPSLADVQDLLREARRRTSFVVFCGAEALLRPDIVDVIGFATSIGLRTSAFTNGQVLARDGVVKQLVDAGLGGLQVSFHFPDPASFARGTGLQPGHFERLLQGLRNVRDYNLLHPGAPIPITTETGLSTFNYRHLAQMRALLLENLGPSFKRMRLGCIHPCGGHLTEPMLEPIAGRREELVSFLATHPPEVALTYSKVPLCLVPGWEHLSLEVAYRGQGVVAFDNNSDNRILEETNARLEELARNPYRWVCRDCSLLALCRVVRTDWRSPAFLPTREQMPLPFRDTTPESVIARVLAPGSPIPALGLLGAQAASISLPEVDLQALVRQAAGPDSLLSFFHDRTPVLDFDWQHDNHTARFKWTFPRPEDDLGFLFGYLALIPHAGSLPLDEPVHSLICALAAIPLPPRAAWTNHPGRLDMHLASAAQTAFDLFGNRLWPGFGRWGDWFTEGARVTASGGIAAQLRNPGGGAVDLIVRRRGDPRDEWAAANAVETSQARVYVRPGAGGAASPDDTASLLRKILSVVWKRVPDDLRAWPPSASPIAMPRANSQASIVARIEDRQGRAPAMTFLLLCGANGRAALAHRPAVGGKALQVGAAVLTDAIRAVTVPPSRASFAAWQEAILRIFGQSALASRFDCHVEPG